MRWGRGEGTTRRQAAPGERRIGGALQGQHPHLRPVAVGHDDLVVAGDLGDGAGRGDDIGPLGLGVGSFAA
jgi:hypothetical protein